MLIKRGVLVIAGEPDICGVAVRKSTPIPGTWAGKTRIPWCKRTNQVWLTHRRYTKAAQGPVQQSHADAPESNRFLNDRVWVQGSSEHLKRGALSSLKRGGVLCKARTGYKAPTGRRKKKKFTLRNRHCTHSCYVRREGGGEGGGLPMVG